MTILSIRSAACAAALAFGLAAPGYALEGASAARLQEPGVQALQALGIEGNASISWDGRTRNGSDYGFTGFRQEIQGAVTTAQSVEFHGLRMGSDGPVFDALTIRGGRIISDEEPLTLEYDVLSITGPSQALIDVLAAGFSGEDADAALSSDIIEQIAREMVLEGLWLASPADLEAGSPEFRAGVERIYLSNPDLDGFADMGLTGLSLRTGPSDGGLPVELTLARAEGTGILVASLLNGLDPETFDPALTFTRTMERFDLSDFLIKAGGVRIAMPSLSTVMTEARDGRLRTSSTMPSLSLVIDPTADEQSAQAAAGLAALGYERLNFAFEGSSIYDPAQDRMYTDSPNAITMDDGGVLDLRYDLSGLTEYMAAAMAFQADGAASGADLEADAAALGIFSSLQIRNASMSFTDAGLLERGLSLFAAQSGSDIATARAQAVGMVALLSMGAGDALPPATVTQMSQALTGFLQSGGTLSITLDPPQPLSVLDMTDETGGFDAAAAGLTFSHEFP